MAATQVISYPAGNADVQTPAYLATLPVSITNLMTIINPATLTGAMTINLTIDQGIKAGARIIVTALSDGTARTITFGTGFRSPTLAGVISKTKSIEFVYNGTTFDATSAGVQID
jgi:uncharacterized membrane protein